MIWNIIINSILVVFDILISAFPIADTAVLTYIANGLSPFKTAISGANWLFPVAPFFQVISYVLAIEGIILTIKLLHWIVKNITVGFVK